MLLKLRSGQNNFFMTILLGLLIASFAIFGIGSNILTGSNQSVATVGDTEVPAQRYYDRVQNRARTLQSQLGGQFSTQEIIRMMGLQEQILQQMIAEAAITEHLSALGLRAGNGEVRTELESFEGFVLPDGSVSKDMVLSALNRTGLSRADFMKDVREGISRRHLLQSFISEAMMPKQFAEALYVWQAERRMATMINIEASNITDIAAPSEGELLEYYEANKGGYRTDERRSYSYILVTPQQFFDEVELAEEDIINEYNSRSDEFIQAENRGLQQVSFADLSAANAFLTALQSGADFVEAGAAVTDYKAEEIELGDFPKSEMVTEYDQETADVVFALEDGGVSHPLQAFGGWNIFKVASIAPATEVSLEEARSGIEATLKEYGAIEKMYKTIDTISDVMIEETSLALIAEKTNLPLATVSNVNAQGVNTAGFASVTQQNEGIILRDAFSKELGIEANITDLDARDSEKGLYLLELNELTEPTERSFDDVKAEAEAAWLAARKLEKAAEIAASVKDRLAVGDDPELVAETFGGTSFNAKNISRTADTNSGLSANIRSLIFELGNKAIDFERAADGNGYVVVRVDEIHPGDPSDKTSEVAAMLTTLNGQLVDEVFIQYQAYLLNLYDPIPNRVLVQSLFAEGAQQ